jgi:hypothetical protein
MVFDLENIKWVNDHRNLPQAYYKIKVPSVSAILDLVPDPELDAFIQAVGKTKADQIMTAAGFRGSSMHTFIETYISTLVKTKEPSSALKFTQEESPKLLTAENVPEDKIKEGLDLFYKFYYSEFSNQYLEIIGMEMGIYSPSLFYRGKLDMFYKHRIFDYAVTDFKSMSTPIKEGSVKEYKMKLQLGGYSNALDEMYRLKGLVIKYGSLICINKKDDEVKEIACSGVELQKMKEEFRNLVKEYHAKNHQEYLIQSS